jgi:hypothetical protein
MTAFPESFPSIFHLPSIARSRQTASQGGETEAAAEGQGGGGGGGSGSGEAAEGGGGAAAEGGDEEEAEGNKKPCLGSARPTGHNYPQPLRLALCSAWIPRPQPAVSRKAQPAGAELRPGAVAPSWSGGRGAGDRAAAPHKASSSSVVRWLGDSPPAYWLFIQQQQQPSPPAPAGPQGPFPQIGVYVGCPSD